MNRKLNKLILTLAVFLTVICAFPGIISEASKSPTFPSKMTMTLYKKSAGGQMVSKDTPGLSGLSATDNVTISVKSSNSKVLAVAPGPATGLMWFIPKKAGNATVTINAKVNDMPYNYKCKVTVKKYSNPFKTFKIGSKDYTAKFKNTSWVELDQKSLSGKLNISLKKNWKLTSLKLLNANGKSKTIKNKKNVSLKTSSTKYVQQINYTIKNKKTGAVIDGSFAIRYPQ